MRDSLLGFRDRGGLHSPIQAKRLLNREGWLFFLCPVLTHKLNEQSSTVHIFTLFPMSFSFLFFFFFAEHKNGPFSQNKFGVFGRMILMGEGEEI